MNKPIIAITAGDPGGIGPEIIAKSFQGFCRSDGFYYLVIGLMETFEFLKEKFGWKLPLNIISKLEPSSLREDAINFLDVSQEAVLFLGKTKKQSSKQKFSFDIGKVSTPNAAVAYAAMKIAANQAAAGLVDAIVTAPVNKTSMRLIEPKFQGHTEYLAKTSRTRDFAMMFVSDRLKVTLVTIHVPIKKVSLLIQEDLVFEKIRLTNEFLKTQFQISNPRLAVCALNPHGRETGEEDDEKVLPAVKRAAAKKINVTGPLSADQLFHDAYEGKYDAVISMYHDQGLAPFKMIAFRDGVNVTLGLPFVRTSPDHGTAFDLAYQGKAEPESMKAALALAEKLVMRTKPGIEVDWA